jgi:hypothetical protein
MIARATLLNDRTVIENDNGRLSFKQHEIILKWYWKFENVCEVQRERQHEFAMHPPT